MTRIKGRQLQNSALKIQGKHGGTYMPVLEGFRSKLVSSLTNLSASETLLLDSMEMAEPAKRYVDNM